MIKLLADAIGLEFKPLTWRGIVVEARNRLAAEAQRGAPAR